MAATALAQPASTGKISGRVFNPATQQYVRNAEIRVAGTDVVAYSGDDGSYVLANIPAGDRALTVTYTGYDVASLFRRASRGHRGRGSDHLKIRRLARILDSSHEEGNVGPLTASVSV